MVWKQYQRRPSHAVQTQHRWSSTFNVVSRLTSVLPTVQFGVETIPMWGRLYWARWPCWWRGKASCLVLHEMEVQDFRVPTHHISLWLPCQSKSWNCLQIHHLTCAFRCTGMPRWWTEIDRGFFKRKHYFESSQSSGSLSRCPLEGGGAGTMFSPGDGRQKHGIRSIISEEDYWWSIHVEPKIVRAPHGMRQELINDCIHKTIRIPQVFWWSEINLFLA